MMNNCTNHDWEQIGYYNAGFGISTSCIVLWCKYCGSLKKSNKIKKPRIVNMIKRINRTKFAFKPTKPTPPNKIIVNEKSLKLDAGTTLEEILNFAQGKDASLVKVKLEWYGPGAGTTYLITYDEEQINANYDKEYSEYLKDLGQYKKDSEEYLQYKQKELDDLKKI